MIEESTVFVLGAGASKPFGFPIGIELKDKILDIHKKDVKGVEEELASYTQISFYKVKEFFQDFAIAPDSSIDFFLSKRQEFIPVGKYLIAKTISQYEDPTQLSGNKDWYGYIFHQMANSCSKEDFKNNKIKFITFNYDRSLEYFLNSAFKASFGGSTLEGTFNLVKDIEIIHLHGKVGYLPWENLEESVGKNVRDYSKSIYPDKVLNISDMIKIISEVEPKSPEFLRAKEVLNNAEKVVLIGLGKNFENFNRLGLNIIANKIPKKIFISSTGLTTNEVEEIRDNVFQGNSDVIFDQNHHMKGLDFLRNFVRIR